MSDKYISSGSASSDITESALIRLTHKYGIGNLNPYVPPASTSDLAMPSFPHESDKEFWGTPESWKELESRALSSDEFDELTQYLLDSGQAST